MARQLEGSPFAKIVVSRLRVMRAGGGVVNRDVVTTLGSSPPWSERDTHGEQQTCAPVAYQGGEWKTHHLHARLDYRLKVYTEMRSIAMEKELKIECSMAYYPHPQVVV